MCRDQRWGNVGQSKTLCIRRRRRSKLPHAPAIAIPKDRLDLLIVGLTLVWMPAPADANAGTARIHYATNTEINVLGTILLDHPDSDSRWCPSQLALQLRLGSLPIQRHRIGAGHRSDPGAVGKGLIGSDRRQRWRGQTNVAGQR